MKDNFSTHSDQYAKFRPEYPRELFDFIDALNIHKENAWDCGTGNGQVAATLSESFKHVFATDISESQLQNAVQKPNITYSVQAAEQTDFPDNFFDLIVVAQAIHWFDFDQFYREVRRTARANAFLVVTGYGLLRVSEEVDEVIAHFYNEIIGKYWDKERKYIDENYQTIPFPFEEMAVPEFRNEKEWRFEHLVGYLKTWSAVKHYEKQQGVNPVDVIAEDLKTAWGDAETRKIYFPILLRVADFEKLSQPITN